MQQSVSAYGHWQTAWARTEGGGKCWGITSSCQKGSLRSSWVERPAKIFQRTHHIQNWGCRLTKAIHEHANMQVLQQRDRRGQGTRRADLLKWSEGTEMVHINTSCIKFICSIVYVLLIWIQLWIFLLQKEDPRIEGPWTDKEVQKYIPRQYRDILDKLYPYQQHRYCK